MLVIGVCLVIGYVVVGSFFDKRYDAPKSQGGAEPESNQRRDHSQQQEGKESQRQEHKKRDEPRQPGAAYAPFGPRWATVLGVPATASKDEIAAAYKRKISEYHPDKVTRMGPEIRALADMRSKEINAAYDEALRRFV